MSYHTSSPLRVGSRVRYTGKGGLNGETGTIEALFIGRFSATARVDFRHCLKIVDRNELKPA